MEDFFGLLKFQIFLGVLKIPDIFGEWTVDAGPGPTYEEKMRVPPLDNSAATKFGVKLHSFFTVHVSYKPRHEISNNLTFWQV